jgi:hypothetical protein
MIIPRRPPLLQGRKLKSYSVRLDPRDADYLRRIVGGGNLSLGLARVLYDHHQRLARRQLGQFKRVATLRSRRADRTDAPR